MVGMKQAVFRLFLIVLPLLFLIALLFLTSKKQASLPLTKKSPSSLCPFILAYSPFSLSLSLQLEKSALIKKLISAQREVKEAQLPPEGLQLSFYLPIHLSKDGKEIVSPQPYIVFSSKNRKEISSLTFQELKDSLSPESPIKLSSLMNRFPKERFFIDFTSKGTSQKVQAFYKEKRIDYITSNDFPLLKQFAKESPFKLIYDFKQILRFQLLQSFLLEQALPFHGDGMILPSFFTISQNTLAKLKNLHQLLFLKSGRLNKNSLPLLKHLKGLITDDISSVLHFIKKKSPCLQKN